MKNKSPTPSRKKPHSQIMWFELGPTGFGSGLFTTRRAAEDESCFVGWRVVKVRVSEVVKPKARRRK